jgi:hypothetical protein
MKNALNIEVTKPDNILVIMRGIPGAGKSTEANKLVGDGLIHSTDSLIEASGIGYGKFFKDMIDGKDFSPLHRMHGLNNKNVKTSIDEDISPIILDNTNIKANEPKELVEYALKAGYADENIKFVEVGTAGLTAEALADRNTHGVPLDKIEGMIKAMTSVGPLTVTKVIKAKPMFKMSNILYTAVVLDETSKSKLLTALKHKIPKDWDIIAHHMTITFGKGLPKEIKEDKGKVVHLTATDIGISDMAVAVKVSGYQSKNEIPHITLGVNPDGGKPVMSNDIDKWEKLDSHINLSGIVTEFKRT